jgi:aspartokinase
MKIGGMIERTDLTLYRFTSIEDQPGSAGSILKLFAQNRINLEFITETSCAEDKAVLAICIASDNVDKIDKILQSEDIILSKMRLKKIENVSMLGIYGPHFREKPAIAAKFCLLLGSTQINILGISSSISSVVCLIKNHEVETAKAALLEVFELP